MFRVAARGMADIRWRWAAGCAGVAVRGRPDATSRIHNAGLRGGAQVRMPDRVCGAGGGGGGGGSGEASLAQEQAHQLRIGILVLQLPCGQAACYRTVSPWALRGGKPIDHLAPCPYGTYECLGRIVRKGQLRVADRREQASCAVDDVRPGAPLAPRRQKRSSWARLQTATCGAPARRPDTCRQPGLQPDGGKKINDYNQYFFVIKALSIRGVHVTLADPDSKFLLTPDRILAKNENICDYELRLRQNGERNTKLKMLERLQ